jgi:putative membrane protein
MSTKKTLPQLCSIATLAMLFGASSGWAQTSQGQSQGTMPSTTMMPSTSGTGEHSTTTQSTTKQSTTTTSGAEMALNKSDQKMLKDMAYTNLSEIAAGKLALSKTQNENVRTYAQKMVDDHTLALQDLDQIAQKKNIKLPTAPDSNQQAMLKRLEKLSGTAFDQRYMAQGGLTNYQKTHKLLQQAQTHAHDAELKAAAGKTLAVVNEHLASVQQWKRSGAPTSTGSSGASGSSDKSGSGTSGAGSSGTTGSGGYR